MSDTSPQATTPVQAIQVYRSDAFIVTDGANLGDDLTAYDDLFLDDVYQLEPDANLLRLMFHPLDDGSFVIADDTELGTPGGRLVLDCTLHLMSPDGSSSDAVILVELDATNHISGLYMMPLAKMRARSDYTLVSASKEDVRRAFAETACVSFSSGTHITMSNGMQVPIEDLSVGDRVLTRDSGAQEIRWIGRSTLRAVGAFAPILIRAGALHNEGDLMVSPDHRLFVFQRSDEIGAGKRELLVKARHLVNGDSVTVQYGGFVDYHQILFDRHHIIYAEGIAAESTLISPHTRPALPDALFAEDAITHATSLARGFDVSQSLLSHPDTLARLRRASTR